MDSEALVNKIKKNKIVLLISGLMVVVGWASTFTTFWENFEKKFEQETPRNIMTNVRIGATLAFIESKIGLPTEKQDIN